MKRKSLPIGRNSSADGGALLAFETEAVSSLPL